MRDPRPTFRLSLVVFFVLGLALMWWWPTRAPEEGAPAFPPVVPLLPGAVLLDAGGFDDGGRAVAP